MVTFSIRRLRGLNLYMDFSNFGPTGPGIEISTHSLKKGKISVFLWDNFQNGLIDFHMTFQYVDIEKKLYDLFLWMGFNFLKATEPLRGDITFYHSVPRSSWYSFDRPRADERLSWTWSHLVVLNPGPLD